VPLAPPRRCTAPGCPAFVSSGRYCPAHAVEHEHARPNWDTRKWYRRDRWKRLRVHVIFDAALRCANCGEISEYLEVDHIEPVRDHPAAFFDRANLQALCPSCHAAKTARGA
jgi:5-methylcytosine-specific restriction endonuclease McrA